MLIGLLVGREVGQVLAVEQDAPGGRRLEAGEHAQQRGLAAARRAEQGEDLALGDVQLTWLTATAPPPKSFTTSWMCQELGAAAAACCPQSHLQSPVLKLVYRRVIVRRMSLHSASGACIFFMSASDRNTVGLFATSGLTNFFDSLFGLA